MERLIAKRTRIDRELHRMGAEQGWLTAQAANEPVAGERTVYSDSKGRKTYR